MYKPILWLEPYRHLQTTELIFRVRLIAQVNISFWYLKQPHRKDRIWADSCSSCLQSAAKNTDDSPDLVPSSSSDNKWVSNSTCAYIIHFHREQARLWDRSASHPKTVTSWAQLFLFIITNDRIFKSPTMPVSLPQVMLNESSLNHDHVPPNTHKPRRRAHTDWFLYLQSLSSSLPTTPWQHLPSHSKDLWWWHYVLINFSHTQLPAGERQDFYSSNNLSSSNNLASTYSFDLFSHSSSVSNLKEWAVPHMLPAFTSLFLLFFLLAPPHLFPHVLVLVSRHISKSLLPSLPRTSQLLDRWILRFWSTFWEPEGSYGTLPWKADYTQN